ncbi:calcium-binding protein [Tropicibacter naphthalenivorans]|uniref:Hemolysin, chromosomal n=1 Tax=Tropicibacter naphthalenivorans TaxID=441103 RepID=A0A0P1G737_9RHOB|nr:calcium-binding protein [Tropicibacter naphthalenivorans]CUH77516.1 Hemolysin, chromosomal [Tropicibacter naphthalenivorans]SMC56635.1 Ca2+-binding protein, RTX toxin-related [Tropicibacter naphthalenivorans]
MRFDFLGYDLSIVYGLFDADLENGLSVTDQGVVVTVPIGSIPGLHEGTITLTGDTLDFEAGTGTITGAEFRSYGIVQAEFSDIAWPVADVVAMLSEPTVADKQSALAGLINTSASVIMVASAATGFFHQHNLIIDFQDQITVPMTLDGSPVGNVLIGTFLDDRIAFTGAATTSDVHWDALNTVSATPGSDTITLAPGYYAGLSLRYDRFVEGLTMDVDGQTGDGTVITTMGTDTISGLHHVLATSDLILSGSQGDDTIRVTGAGDGHVFINGDGGSDRFELTLDGVLGLSYGWARAGTSTGIDLDLSTGQVADNGFGGQDTIVQTPGSGYLIVEGSEAADRMIGDDFDNLLAGMDADDTIQGGRGNDSLYGGLGDDDLHGQTGQDDLFGYDGNDRLRGGTKSDYLDGGNGDDSLAGQRHGDTLHGGSGADTLKGGGGSDYMNGGDGDDFLKGGTYQDTLYGSYGNDTLTANRHDDYLDGGEGDDLLLGGGGEDTLFGNWWNDTLKGGADADLFLFDDSYGSDVILDFNAADGDRIGLTFGLANARELSQIAADMQVMDRGTLLSFNENVEVFLTGVVDLDAAALSDTLVYWTPEGDISF